jgi:hypothetical protein
MRAAVAVQRALGRALTASGSYVDEIGVTDVDSGLRAVLAVDGDTCMELWTDHEGVVWHALDDEGG